MTRNTKHIISIILTIVPFSIVLPIFSFAQPSTNAKDKVEFSVIRNGIVHIGLKPLDLDRKIGWAGTGFCVNDDCVFATAKHVLSDLDTNRIVVGFQHPKDRGIVRIYNVRVAYLDSTQDIAFLKIKNTGDKSCSSSSLYNFPLYRSYLSDNLVGKEIVIIGHPQISDSVDIDIPIMRHGIIASVEITLDYLPMILLDLHGVPGFSGSPVILKESGEVIGIIYGPGSIKRIIGFEFATPITNDYYLKTCSLY